MVTMVGLNEFGKLVRTRRKSKGWSQSVLAHEALGNDNRKGYISNLENGKLQNIRISTAQAISRALAIEDGIIELVTGVSSPNENELQNEIDFLRHERGSLHVALENTERLNRLQIVSLAIKFGINSANRKRSYELQIELETKAEEYRALLKQINAIDERVRGLSEIKAAAFEAAERLDFQEVEKLLAKADTAETEVIAQTKELRAANALVMNQETIAYEHYVAAANTFENIDREETARRCFTYDEKLYLHGLKYGDKGLKLSEKLLRHGLERVDETKNPELWSFGRNNLGNAIQARARLHIGSQRVDLIDQAIGEYELALRYRDKKVTPRAWAMTHNNIGLGRQLKGSRIEGEEGLRNLSIAVSQYETAMEIFTAEDFPKDWAMVQNNIAIAYRNKGARIDGYEGVEYLDMAISSYKNAMSVRTKKDFPDLWARTQNNLGTALMDRAVKNVNAADQELLRESISSFENALLIRTEKSAPIEWASSREGLGQSCRHLSLCLTGVDGDKYLDRALRCHQDALKYRSEDDGSAFWAETQESLATLFFQLAKRTTGSRKREHKKHALEHVNATVQTIDRESEYEEWSRLTKLQREISNV